ncbi:MAG: type II toxin-antitoxin system HicB family antitoxin [Dehalococcoidia bacterium]|nr:type II toxin-antitoxin system HicB family antitoxin [Dehalococcoidia bacterium]
MKRYTIMLIPDPEEGGYTATVPALPGCITEGDTLEETLENAKDAIRLYLEDVEASGERIPEESMSPQLATVEV